MPKNIISDASTLILFHKIDELNLLQKVYGSRLFIYIEHSFREVRNHALFPVIY
jgi:predicted nucleic acid-binding protein